MKEKALRINIGCGGRPLPGYINIDSDSLEEMQKRYPAQNFPEGTEIFDYDIFNLPYEDNSVSEIRADSLIEHLSFKDESRFFVEIKRVLKKGAVLNLSTTDFEEIARMWLAAKDDWKEFFRDDAEAIIKEHWFGQYSYSTENRWGYLNAMIFGSQNGEGQFHKNYTEGKLAAILKYLGFVNIEISRFRWKGDRDPMLRVTAVRN